jgi:hypothetical protein
LNGEEQIVRVAGRAVADDEQRGEYAPNLNHEQDRIARHLSWVEFDERIFYRSLHNRRIEKGSLVCSFYHTHS